MGKAVQAAKKQPGFQPESVVGIGVDTTGSTPIPVDRQGMPLSLQPEFQKDLAAYAWLWKDHTGHAEAAEITDKARRERATATWPSAAAPTAANGTGRRSCTASGRRPKVFAAAYSWVELADFVPAFLTGNLDPDTLPRGICAAGHKAMYNEQWGGLPEPAVPRRASTRPWPPLAERYATPGADGRPQGRRADRRGRRRRSACRRASPWPSAPSTPTWAPSARASSRARW